MILIAPSTYEYGREGLFHAPDDRDHEIHDRLHPHVNDYSFAPDVVGMTSFNTSGKSSTETL
jgi:hypothetical protein